MHTQNQHKSPLAVQYPEISWDELDDAAYLLMSQQYAPLYRFSLDRPDPFDHANIISAIEQQRFNGLLGRQVLSLRDAVDCGVLLAQLWSSQDSNLAEVVDEPVKAEVASATRLERARLALVKAEREAEIDIARKAWKDAVTHRKAEIARLDAVVKDLHDKFELLRRA